MHKTDSFKRFFFGKKQITHCEIHAMKKKKGFFTQRNHGQTCFIDFRRKLNTLDIISLYRIKIHRSG